MQQNLHAFKSNSTNRYQSITNNNMIISGSPRLDN